MHHCDMIRDLMPLYADGQASENSRRIIEEHTDHCPACQKMLKEMCAPLEPEPEERTAQILEMLRQKQRRKTIRIVIAIALAVIFAVWGFLELAYSGTLMYAASTSEEKILKEMPELALTEAELELGQTIVEIPLIQEALSNDYENTATLNPGDLMEELTPILPEGGKIIEVFVMGPSINISIIAGNRYTCLVYNDVDMTGHIDLILKVMAVSPYDEIGADGRLGNVKATYELTHAVGIGTVRCHKYKTRHMWFSFLDWE